MVSVLFTRRNAASLLFYLFDVIIKISAINCCIEFITVANYVELLLAIATSLCKGMNLICISKDFIS